MTDNTQALDALWNAVEAAALAMRRPTGATYNWGGADDEMRDADADALLGWADDVAARLGFDEGAFRAAIHDYLLIRDGAPQGMTPEDHAAALTDLHARCEDDSVRDACYEAADVARATWHADGHRPDGTANDLARAEVYADAMTDMECAL